MKPRHLFAVLLLALLPAAAARAGVFISIAPPPLVVYEQPPCPAEGYLWSPGYYAYDYDAGSYYWVDGVWVAPPRVGYLWTPGYWGYSGGGYVYNAGYWGPTVGFYGGINYGYGYGGYGYDGGRWDGRTFRYNTAITRVNTNVVHNTYEDRNAFRNAADNRASFNGKGGVEARPDQAQLAAARGAHLKAVSAQTDALRQARTAHANTAGGPRTANAARGGRTSRTNRAVAGAPGSNPRPLRGTAVRGGGGTRQARPAFTQTRNPQFARGPRFARGPQGGRAPQVVRQAKAAPQPRGGGQKGGGKGKKP